MNQLGQAQRKTISVAEFFFLAFWVLKPFYIFQSGSIQPSDMLLFVSFFAMLVEKKTLSISRENEGLVLFWVCVLVIDALYSIILRNTISRNVMYYTYSLITVFTAEYLCAKRSFVQRLQTATCLNLFIQMGLYLTGIGESLGGGSRYMSTFNDPNQFAFSVVTMFFVIFIIGTYSIDAGVQVRKQKWIIAVSLVFAWILVFESASTGMLIAIAVFTFLFAIRARKHKETFSNLPRKRSRFSTGVKALMLVVSVGAIAALIDIEEVISVLGNSEQFLLRRVAQKLAKFVGSDGGSLISFFEERGLDKLYLYPQYLLFGAGGGNYQRFTEAWHQGEIHSTFPAFLFCYGIIPFCILMRWIWSKCKGQSYLIWCVYIAVFLESFTLANQRQPVFWVIIILPYIIQKQQLFQCPQACGESGLNEGQ